MTAIVWFREDLRLTDHSPFSAACASGEEVLPVFILAPDQAWAPGAASRVWLHHSLAALARDLEALGCDLLLRIGQPEEVLEDLVRASRATMLTFNTRVEPAGRLVDEAIVMRFSGRLALRQFTDGLLVDPERLRTGSGHPYRVFTPFWRKMQEVVEPAQPCAVPSLVRPCRARPEGSSLQSLGLLPSVPWDTRITACWQIGEAAAKARLQAFIQDGLAGYAIQRDYPGEDGVSRLSPHLHFGEITPRQVWHAVNQASIDAGRLSPSAAAVGWLRQLAWREFAHYLLHHFPATPEAPLREEFRGFPWREDAAGLRRWQRGETGYPVVDAAMRELWHTGWMHNRARMIVASFLTKDIGIHWLAGARWFWDTLVDANLANNTLGWQWVAGCGADAAPYYRIFNPVLQSARFDPEGRYLRRWLPELAALPTSDLHAPWRAGAITLAAAGITLGVHYPTPMLDHQVARELALSRMKRKMK